MTLVDVCISWHQNVHQLKSSFHTTRLSGANFAPTTQACVSAMLL